MAETAEQVIKGGFISDPTAALAAGTSSCCGEPAGAKVSSCCGEPAGPGATEAASTVERNCGCS